MSISSQETDVDVQDRHGKTALHLAAGCGNVDAVNLLLKHGVMLLKDESGRDPLEYARQKSQTDVLPILQSYKERKQRRKDADMHARLSPFSLCEPSGTEPTTGLLVSVHNQLMLMHEARILEIERDQNREEIIAILKNLDPVRALLELKSFCASDLRNVQFRSKKLLQQLQRASSMFPKTDSEELWLTRGACVSGQMEKSVYPELVLMSRDESMVMVEMGMQVQEHKRFPGYLEKIFHLPPPSIGLPEPAKLFSGVKFVVSRAANAAKSLNDVKCELDDKDIRVRFLCSIFDCL
jgi:hypothetical protein